MFEERNAHNLLGHELIGLSARAARGKSDLRGTISYETKNTLELDTPRGTKRVPKKGTQLDIRVGKNTAHVDGGLLVARPEDRTKLFLKKYAKKMRRCQ